MKPGNAEPEREVSGWLREQTGQYKEALKFIDVKLLQAGRWGTDRSSVCGGDSVCPADAHSTLSDGSSNHRTSVPLVKR